MTQNQVDVIVVNGHGVGEYCNVKKIPVVGETAKCWNRHFEEDGGKGTNVAIAIAKLGGKVAFVGKAGDDEGGRLGKKWMGDAGADLSHYWLDPNISTGLGLCIIAEDGNNMILDFEDGEDSINIPELDEHLRQFSGVKYLVTGFEVPEEVSLYAARLGKELGMTTVLNPSPLEERTDLGDLSYVDMLFINETEAKIMLGKPIDEDLDMLEAARTIRERYHTPNVIITLGGDGSIAVTEEGEWETAVYPADCIDQCGAGDGFLSAFIWCLTQGKNMKDAMTWASRYAAYVVSHEGTAGVYPTMKQLDEFFK